MSFPHLTHRETLRLLRFLFRERDHIWALLLVPLSLPFQNASTFSFHELLCLRIVVDFILFPWAHDGVSDVPARLGLEAAA